MPVTPFHFGPAATVKAVAGGHFSLVMFALSQAVIDFEPFIYMAQGMWPIHRFLHTYLGATLVALVAAFVGKPLCEWALRLWNARLSDSQRKWLGVNAHITTTAAIMSALFGAWSHVLLDSFMHSDIRPWAPLSDHNGLLRLISIDHLYILCALFGMLGGIVLLVLEYRSRRRIRK